MTETSRQAAIDAFIAWRARPEPHKRLAELEQLAREAADIWCEAILSLISDAAGSADNDFLDWGLVAALRAAADRTAMEAELARHAHASPVVAGVVADALRFGSRGVGERRALDVLGELFVFDAWSRYHQKYRSEDRGEQQPDVAVDYWAWELMQALVDWDPVDAWRRFLRYLAHERDPDCRVQAGIAWLESINFGHAAEFIDRIEAEARRNERLRAVMRGMYPPSDDANIERRFRAAAEEAGGGGVN